MGKYRVATYPIIDVMSSLRWKWKISFYNSKGDMQQTFTSQKSYESESSAFESGERRAAQYAEALKSGRNVEYTY